MTGKECMARRRTGGEALSSEQFRRLFFVILPDRREVSRGLQVSGSLCQTSAPPRPFNFFIPRRTGADFQAAAHVFRFVGAALGRPTPWLSVAGAGGDCISDPRFRFLDVLIQPSECGQFVLIEANLCLEGEPSRRIGFSWPRREGVDFAIASIVFQKIDGILERRMTG